MDFETTESQELIRKTIRDFAAARIAPRIRELDESMEFPHDAFRGLAELALTGIFVPEEWGGAGMGYLEYATAIEEVSRVDPSVGLTLAAHLGLATNAIFQSGSKAQKERWLRPLASGEAIGAWALTEPGSGSDAGGMRTTAVRDGASWVLNGTKNFCTNGSVADIAVVYARTDPAAGKRGVGCFVVEKGTPGFVPGKKENKLGMRASDTAEIALTDCRVPDEHLLGGPGEGFAGAMKVLDGGRIAIAALGVGIAQGAYEAALAYSRQRQAFGQPIASFQAIQNKLADMATEIDAARLLTWRAAVLKDQGHTVTLEASMAKLFASEVACRVADHGVQIHGGYGYVKDYPAEKFFRDAKLCTIGEGTSEIQRTVIARKLVES